MAPVPVPNPTNERPLPSRPQIASEISFSEIISALTFAIDLTEGAVPGHALRTCILGMRIADAIQLPVKQQASLHSASMLKDVRFGSNSGRMSQVVGSPDPAMKLGAKVQNWTRPHRPTLDTVKLLWHEVLPESSALQRLARIGRIALTQHRNSAEMIALRCERGADIAEKLGLSVETVQAIRALDEHWDGSGYPERLSGADIPLLARILGVAQHLDVCASERDQVAAIQALHERSNRWFDPTLVHVVNSLDNRNVLWTKSLVSDGTDVARRLVLDLEPTENGLVLQSDVDRICEAFADVVDAKSPFTYRHSIGVADVATSMARVLQLAPDRVQLVRRAALLHDLGKLAVPNTILDKTEHLTSEEWEVVVQHPRLTREILSRIDSFGELAEVAGAHHEKLDGSGYPDGLTAQQLSLEARIVAVADVYQALIERRPYRQGMSHAEAMVVLHRLAGQKLDPHCVAAVAVARDPWTVWTPTTASPHPPRRGPMSVTSGIRAAASLS